MDTSGQIKMIAKNFRQQAEVAEQMELIFVMRQRLSHYFLMTELQDLSYEDLRDLYILCLREIAQDPEQEIQ